MGDAYSIIGRTKDVYNNLNVDGDLNCLEFLSIKPRDFLALEVIIFRCLPKVPLLS